MHEGRCAVHELSITRDILRTVADHTSGRRVTCVRLAIGRLSGVVAESVRFCFDLAARGTPVEGARLEIDEVEGRARCRACGKEFDLPTFVPLCDCGSTDVDVVAGRSLVVVSVEVV